MHLLIENTKKSYPFPENNVLVVGNDSECDVQINHPKVWGRHFSVTSNAYGCVLDVYDHHVLVNDTEVAEKCFLDKGDVIVVDELSFRLLDDAYIPKDSGLNHTNVKLNKNKNTSSVYGIRSFATNSVGQFIIDDFHHKDGWHVFREDNELHYIDSKHRALLNGLQIAQANLSNGDVISNGIYKYKVELPGTSGFSKFSPSHPRNVVLSESFKTTETKPPQPTAEKAMAYFKSNLWWLTLLVGLVMLLLIVISNSHS